MNYEYTTLTFVGWEIRYRQERFELDQFRNSHMQNKVSISVKLETSGKQASKIHRIIIGT